MKKQEETYLARNEYQTVKNGAMALLGFNAAFAGALIVLILYMVLKFGEVFLTTIQ